MEQLSANQHIVVRAGTLVVLSGLPGSGKSALKRHALNLPQGAWVSTDDIREQMLGTMTDLSEFGEPRLHRYEFANNSVFAIAQTIVRERLAARLTTVVDATAINDAERGGWAQLAKDAGAPFKVLILNTSVEQCLQNNRGRDVPVPEQIILNMMQPPAPTIPESAKQRTRPGKVVPAPTPPQGFMLTSRFDHEVIGHDTLLEFRPNELEHSRYDVVGDVHGLLPELLALLEKAGWVYEGEQLSHPQGRKLLFLGDLVDRGPHSLPVLQLVKRAVAAGVAVALQGNHEKKLLRFYDTALREGIDRWTSFANAQTGMELVSLPQPEREGLADFIRKMPACVTWEADKVAFVHGDIHRFDPMCSPADGMVHGQSGFRSDDSDAKYQARFNAGLNKYTMFRGHIPQTSAQANIFSLERQPFQLGELVLMRLDAYLEEVKAGVSSVEAFSKSIITHQTHFDYAEYSKKFAMFKGLEELVANRLVTRQLDESKLFRVYKYSKETFWNNSWGASPWLLKARGIVLDAGGAIVSHPFDKVFNYGENGTGQDIADDEKVVEVEKLNGFLGLISRHPLKKSELLMHTQGGFGGDFVGYIRHYANQAPTRAGISRFLAKNAVTLMFEVLHPDDPHIVEYPSEMMGLHLIGVRGLNQADLPWTEEAVDAAAAEMGLRRPQWRRTTFGEVRQAVLESQTEGVMVRRDDSSQQTLLKWKSPFYLTTKFLGRMSASKAAHLFKNPKDFKKTVDEEFYPLVDLLVERFTKEQLLAMPEEERVAMVRGLVLEMV